MKCILFLFLLILSFSGQSQTFGEIKLSKEVNEERMGLWTKGDYKVYVALSSIASNFQSSSKSYSEAALTYQFTDSSGPAFYKQTAERYQVAADQLEKADDGFDLRSLIVYLGIENENENQGNSMVVESFIKQMVKSGKAAVFYKGERLFVLKSRYESRGEGILDHGYEIRIYVDDPDNYLFTEYQHLGW
jgi:hypothetical protein